jgi:Domain of unknown function (DUF1843)
MTIVAYAPAIQEAIARGDLAQMHDVARLAEEHMREYGNVAVAYELLKIEISRLEARQRGE